MVLVLDSRFRGVLYSQREGICCLGSVGNGLWFVVWVQVCLRGILCGSRALRLTFCGSGCRVSQRSMLWFRFYHGGYSDVLV